MKRSVFFVLLFAITLISLNVNAQKFYVRDLFDFYNEIGNPDHTKQQLRTYDDIDGTPYLQSDFMEGTIIQNDSISYGQVPLRYNGYDDRIEFKHKSGVALYIDKPENFKEFLIADKRYTYQDKSDGKEKLLGYFELLEKGKAILLKKQTITLKEAEPAKPFVDPKPAKFVSKPDTYYILKDETHILELKNEKSLIEILEDQKNKISSFITHNKLKVKKEDDLKKIIAYYNNL